MTRAVRLILVLAALAVLAAGAMYLSLRTAYRGFRETVILDFPKGTSARAMADQLAQNGVIRYAWQFLAVRALHPGKRLLAGEYQFARADTPANILDRIARGDVFFYELTVPEGSNIFDIAASVARFDFLKPAQFLRAARNPALIRDLAPHAPTLEGYLFPSTYRITRSTTEQQLCLMMTGEFRKHWRQLRTRGQAVNDTVTLASLVEKETAVASERPVVASVYENRLQKGMALDCDPTTIYAALLDQRYRGAIFRSDLESDNAYNTYKHAGLPPGPIANPGVASLQAALAPAQTDFLYFVAKADGSGGHQFSKTIEEHNLAVQKYRRAINRQSDPPPPRSRRPSKHTKR
jgi:peptidoglycan lytic transglycosylase G